MCVGFFPVRPCENNAHRCELGKPCWFKTCEGEIITVGPRQCVCKDGYKRSFRLGSPCILCGEIATSTTTTKPPSITIPKWPDDNKWGKRWGKWWSHKPTDVDTTSPATATAPGTPTNDKNLDTSLNVTSPSGGDEKPCCVHATSLCDNVLEYCSATRKYADGIRFCDSAEILCNAIRKTQAYAPSHLENE